MNPITRRPGPGRGRPRKQPPIPIAGAPGAPGQQPQPSASPSDALPETLPAQGSLTPAPADADADAVEEPLSLDPSGEDLDEPPIKRQRLDDNTDPALEDEAVLNALAAHSNPASVDHYTQE